MRLGRFRQIGSTGQARVADVARLASLAHSGVSRWPAGLIPALATAACQRFCSSAMNFANSAGVPPTAIAARLLAGRTR